MKNSILQGLRLDQKVSKGLRAAYETVRDGYETIMLVTRV